MAFCGNCGAKIEEGMKFCPNCEVKSSAEQISVDAESVQTKEKQTDFSDKVAALNNTADSTAEFDKEDIDKNKIMAILAYFGPLVLIPILMAKESKFARYHSNQGLVLLVALIIYSVAYGILSSVALAISWTLYSIISILGFVSILFSILAIIGIINAANGRAKELPIIGKYKLLK